MKLHIADKFDLPPDAVTETFAILGIRGSGKTSTGVVMAEELLKAKQQVVILDPVDVWWGLKSSRDGRSAGFAIPVIGGDHADVPLDATAGAVLADFLADTRASVILSLRHLSMNEQRRLATDFAKQLYDRKGQQRSPLMLIVDEADEFVPQRLPKGHEALFGAFDRLVRRGRSSGIGVTLISQRPQVINKDVLSQVETLIGMRVLHERDRKALEVWIEANDVENRRDEFLKSLATLGKGDAWVWSPSWMNVFQRVHIRQRNTFDSSATPKVGEKVAPPRELAAVDLDKLRHDMAAQIERAEQDDPRALRARIAQLERGAATKPAGGGLTQADVDAAYDRGFTEAKQKGAEKLAEIMQTARGILDKAVAGAFPDTVQYEVRSDRPPARPQNRRGAAPPPLPPRRVPAASNGTGNAEQRILDGLAELEALGIAEAPKVQVAFMAGYTNLNSKGFANAIGALRSRKMLDYPSGGTVALTQDGRAQANHCERPRSDRELQERVIQMLGGANGRIVQELVAVYPNALQRDELARRAGYSNTNSKGFANSIGRLRTLGFIDYPTTGMVRAQDILFIRHSVRSAR